MILDHADLCNLLAFLDRVPVQGLKEVGVMQLLVEKLNQQIVNIENPQIAKEEDIKE
jgi:hypothetical protein